MQNRPNAQQLTLVKPDIHRNNKQVPSLTTLAFSKFAETKQGFFTPSEHEHYTLDAIKRSKNEVAINIKTLPETLGHFAAWGMQQEAKALLAELSIAQLNTALTTIVTIKDYTGRKHTGTAFELALKMGDVTNCKRIKCMAEILAESTRKLENGQAIINQQFTNVFGNSHDAYIKKQQKNVYVLDEVLEAIDKATNEEIVAQLNHENIESNLNDSITIFREKFTTHSFQEEVFNPYHILQTIKIYTSKYDTWEENKSDLLLTQIIGYMQRFWPRCWLQAAATGLWSLTEHKPKLYLQRKPEGWNSVTDKTVSLDQLDDDSCRLGFHFAISSKGRATCVKHVSGWDERISFKRDYENYVIDKVNYYKFLCFPENEKSNRLSV